MAELISVVTILLVFVWMWSGIIYDLAKGRHGRDIGVLRVIHRELHPFIPVIIAAFHVSDSIATGNPWSLVRIGMTAFLLIVWWITPDDDDDRWKRRRKKATEAIRAIGGKLVVVPAAAR